MGLTKDQLYLWLNREPGKVHGSLMQNVDEIIILAIQFLAIQDGEEP